MKPEEIMDRLNAITKAEFELNWSLGEIQRTILNDTNPKSKHVILAKQLEEELNRDITDGYVAKVGCLGTLTIYQRQEGHISPTLLKVKEIHSNYSKLLPYGYVMGKKLPKYAYLKVIEQMK